MILAFFVFRGSEFKRKQHPTSRRFTLNYLRHHSTEQLLNNLNFKNTDNYNQNHFPMWFLATYKFITDAIHPDCYSSLFSNVPSAIDTDFMRAFLHLFSLSQWIKAGLILISLLVSTAGHSAAGGNKGTPVAFFKSFAGNVSFELAAGSFLDNPSDLCSTSASATGGISGNIPDDAKILAAYLYWAGSYKASGNGKNSPDTEVTLNNQSIIASDSHFGSSNLGADFYGGKADVTHIVGNSGALAKKPYTLTDLDIYKDTNKCDETTLGGWAMIVIYEHNSLPFQVTNVFDGFEVVFSNNPVELVLDNFTASPNPSGKHAHLTFEGDNLRDQDKEMLVFNSVELTDSYNQSNRQFNSTSNIYANSSYSTSTLGVDVDSYDISAYIQPGDTTATSYYGSGVDTVLLAAEVISLSNVPVADLGVTSTAPTSWLRGSDVTQKFAITNHGPNDTPAERTQFSLSLPAGVTFNGTQTQSDWQCTQSQQQLDCYYTAKLRSGWSVYFDVDLTVAANATSSVSLTAHVTHDNGTGDILDNVLANNTQILTVPTSDVAVVDLSASSKRPVHTNGDALLAGQTLEYIITLDDASDLDVTNIQVIDSLPLDISAYRITSTLPVGTLDTSTAIANGDNDNTVRLNGIHLAPGETLDIHIEVDINAGAPKGTSLQNIADITYGSGNPTWSLDTGDITVVEYDLSVSSKQATDINGQSVQAGDTIRYTITLKDRDGLAITDLSVSDALPTEFDSYTMINLPAGATNNSSGQHILIEGIDIDAGSQAQIIIDAVLKSDVVAGTAITNTAELQLALSNWSIDSNEIIIDEAINQSTQGNKPLYLVQSGSSDLTRVRPSANSSITVNPQSPHTWTLTPSLASDLTLNNGAFPLQLAILGFENANGSGGIIEAELYSSGQLLAATQSSNQVFENGRLTNLTLAFDLANSITLPAGNDLSLRIINQHSSANIGIESINGSFYSRLILNAQTVINVDRIEYWNGPSTDASAQQITETEVGNTVYVRAWVSDPFGAFDISKVTMTVQKTNGAAVTLNQTDMSWTNTSIDPYSESTKQFEHVFDVAANEGSTGLWPITIQAFEGIEPASEQVVHALQQGFLVKPILPILTIDRNIEVLNDPINGTLNPKAIPGAHIQYTLRLTNIGRGQNDADSLVLIEQIPSGAVLLLNHSNCPSNSGPICFIDGAAPNESGLGFSFTDFSDNGDQIDFSIDGTAFDYLPDPNKGATDDQIRFLRLRPSGQMNPSPDGISITPIVDLTYQVQIQ